MYHNLLLKIKFLLSYITNIIRDPSTELEKNFMTANGYTLMVCCLVIFLETGCILFPFLPGDIFLTLIGTALSNLKIGLTLPIFLISSAAFIGTQFNYFVGYFLGNRLNKVFHNNESYKNNIKKAKPFIKKYGILSVFLSRWCGWLRTFIPFISGALKVPFIPFILCNLLSAFIWVSSFVILGVYCQSFKKIIGSFMTVGFLLPPVMIVSCYILYNFRRLISFLYNINNKD